MRKIFMLLFFAEVLFTKVIAVQYPNDGLTLILDHKKEYVQKIEKEKIYLFPEALQTKNQYFFLEFADSQEIIIPYLFQDSQGYYIMCGQAYYWECTEARCGRAYTSRGGPPSKCKGCGGSSFRKVNVG